MKHDAVDWVACRMAHTAREAVSAVTSRMESAPYTSCDRTRRWTRIKGHTCRLTRDKGRAVTAEAGAGERYSISSTGCHLSACLSLIANSIYWPLRLK